MFVYTFKAPAEDPEPVQKGFLLQGADWFLDEQLGTSYQVLTQSWDKDMLVAECQQKPTDWMGPHFLERIEVPYRIVKRTGEGILLRYGSWNRLFWKGGRPLTRDEVRSF